MVTGDTIAAQWLSSPPAPQTPPRYRIYMWTKSLYHFKNNTFNQWNHIYLYKCVNVRTASVFLIAHEILTAKLYYMYIKCVAKVNGRALDTLSFALTQRVYSKEFNCLLNCYVLV